MMTKTTKQPPMPHIRCECGGLFKRARVEKYDVSGLVGLPTRYSGPGLKCGKCGAVTLTGELVNAALHLVAVEVAIAPARLGSAEARYLRKFLRLTQQALADRFGVARETVAKWETSESLSPQNDYMLRAFVLAHLAARFENASDELREALARLGEGVRTGPPARQAMPAPFVIDAKMAKRWPTLAA